MSAIIAKQVEKNWTHIVQTHASCTFYCSKCFSALVISTNTTAYLRTHSGIKLISFIIACLKTKVSDMFCEGWTLEPFFLLSLWSTLCTTLSLDEHVHFCVMLAAGIKRKTDPFYLF